MLKIIFKYSLICSVIWTVIIFILCSTPGKYVPTAHWLDLLSFDKLVHVSMFFILTSLWLCYFISKYTITPSTVSAVFIGCVAYGGLLEIMQATLFSQRSGDWFDFIANTVGCLIALYFFRKKKLFHLKTT